MRGRRGEGWGHDHGHGWHGRGRHGGGMRRMFDQGDLRLVVMGLLAQQPRHGYDLIKEIEGLSGGLYAPSPGVIYPLLTMLEEMGLARLDSSEGSKKLYALTEQGLAELAQKRVDADNLLERLAAVKERMSGGRAPQIVRAMENLRTALRLRAERGINEEQAQAIAAALDAAAQTIERA
ncbi:PadR family transcriptional regulator [Terricaulis sp.]|uniref:PadR family transcriptional regulator n=1 Tax=Terricaulis sp. TaxID=2768686 RepID=UPI003784EEFA